MTASTPPSPTPSATPWPPRIGFCYSWTTKVALVQRDPNQIFAWMRQITMRKVNEGESMILLVSPKFATVHEHVSFQWNLRVHASTGRLTSEDVEDGSDRPMDYVAVELYFIDGPVSQVQLNAEVGVVDKDSELAVAPRLSVVQEGKALKMQRGKGCEITDSDRAIVSGYLKEAIGKIVKINVLVKMEAKLFDPFTYLDKISPTPNQSFLTTNYNARVNSKVWKRRSRKCRSGRTERSSMSSKEKTGYEEKFQAVLDSQRPSMSELKVRSESLSAESCGSRRSSLIEQLRDEKPHHGHEHIFKKILVSCCDSCELRRASIFEGKSTEEETDVEDEVATTDDEEPHFECGQSDKEHVHDMLANLYFNKVALPEMEYVEDFVDFLIDAELNDLPVLKRACERYLCSELNTKKDLTTSLLLDLLFIAIVFNLSVMKSMTLSELANRTHELVNLDVLLEQDEYKQLDGRMKKLADGNLMEVIEQCIAFRDQKARVRSVQLANEPQQDSVS